MRRINELTDAECHKLYCIARYKRDDIPRSLFILRGPHYIRIQSGKNGLLHLTYYTPSINNRLGNLNIRARDENGQTAHIQIVDALDYLTSIGVAIRPIQKFSTEQPA